jgi:uncharacterized protein
MAKTLFQFSGAEVFINQWRFSNMAGTKAGGRAAADTNRKKYGTDFYSRIGAAGGKKGRTGGFFANRELAREAGRKGGRISRRTKVAKVTKKDVDLAA